MNKILLVDKPADWTSFDVVAKIRGKLRQNDAKVKVGHAGTLDPFATGLLIVLVGSATKDQDKFMKLDKEYEATLFLGATSTTGDPEGEISPTSFAVSSISESKIDQTLRKFTGEISQIPPAYSAIKVDGKRAYKLAREGKEVKIEPRKVTIYEIELKKYDFPVLIIRVKCSSGTYVRTLAEEIGKELGYGAYLTALRRTKIGEYNIDDSKRVEEAINALNT